MRKSQVFSSRYYLHALRGLIMIGLLVSGQSSPGSSPSRRHSALNSWPRHFTLTAYLSAQMYDDPAMD